MKTSFASTLAAFGLIASSIPVLIEAATINLPRANQCVVQVKKIDDWSETGMQRYRYAWTSNKEDYWGLGSDGDYNSYSDISIDIRNAIKDSTGGCSSAERNLQGPWWSEDEQAYLTDMSEVQGAGGRSISNCVRDAAENNWMKTSGCSNEIVYAKGSH